MEVNPSNIRPISELEADPAGLITTATEEGPVVITQNGRATAVLVDIHSYEADRRAFAMMRLIAQGEADIADGRTLTIEQHRAQMAELIAAHRRG